MIDAILDLVTQSTIRSVLCGPSLTGQRTESRLRKYNRASLRPSERSQDSGWWPGSRCEARHQKQLVEHTYDEASNDHSNENYVRKY